MSPLLLRFNRGLTPPLAKAGLPPQRNPGYTRPVPDTRASPMLAPVSALARLRVAALAVPPERWRAVVLAALGVLAVVTSVRYVRKIEHPSALGTQTRSAFLRWRGQIVGQFDQHDKWLPGLKQGADVYARYSYPNPPVMALILWPFYELPVTAGAILWFYLKVGMAALAAGWAFRLAADAGRPLPDWAKLLAVVLALHPVLSDLSHGNVNIFIAFLVFGGLDLFRRRWDFSAGVVLALAVACKVTPGLFLPYLLWKRAWKASAGMAVGLGLWLFVVPGAALGWQHNLTLLHSWYDVMVGPFLVDGKITSERANQSIPGTVVRLLTAEPSELAYDEDDKPVPKEFHNLTDIGRANARWVIRGFQAAFALALAVFCRGWLSRSVGPRQGLRFGAEVGLILLGMLLFSERTWKHHAVTLILPYAVLAGALAVPRLRALAAVALIVAAVLTLGPSVLPDKGQDVALVYGAYTAAFLALTAAMCGVITRSFEDAPGPMPHRAHLDDGRPDEKMVTGGTSAARVSVS